MTSHVSPNNRITGRPPGLEPSEVVILILLLGAVFALPLVLR